MLRNIALAVILATAATEVAAADTNDGTRGETACPDGYALSGECANSEAIAGLREEALWRGQADISLSTAPVPLAHDDFFLPAQRQFELLDDFGERPQPARRR